MKCVSCVLAVQRRCDAVVHFAPQELRGGAVDWVGTFRYGGAAAAGSRVERENISIDEPERESEYIASHMSHVHVSCASKRRNTHPCATPRAARPPRRRILTHALRPDLSFTPRCTLHGRCWHAVFNLSRGRTLGSRPQQTLELRCRFVFSCSDLLSYLLTNLYLYIYLPPPEDRPRPARSLCCTRRGVRGAPIDEHALRPAYIASHLLNLPTRHRGGAICIP